ncbi:hypothetical protein [Streptomyces coeruleorubidus]
MRRLWGCSWPGCFQSGGAHPLDACARSGPCDRSGKSGGVLGCGACSNSPDLRHGVSDHAVGTITVTVRDATGPLTLHAADFSSRDENGTAIRLAARGPAAVTARPGQVATLTLVGTYEAGAAELTWRHDGKAVAVWDFNIELD